MDCKKWGRMKPIWFFCSILVLLIFFQNCGGLSERALFSDAGHYGSTPTDECESLECFRSGDFVWLQIREFEPYQIRISNIEGNYFTVGGYCGVGGFSNHRFEWELHENFGAEKLIGRGSENNLCNTGKFQVPIIANQETLNVNRQYMVTLRLIGIQDGVAVRGFPYGEGRVNVLILPPEEGELDP